MQVEDHKVKVEGLEVYYRTAGDKEKQPLVFLHGWGARLGKSWDYFFGTQRVIKELAKHFYVVAPEHPGFMRSQPPKEIWSLEDYAHTLHTLLSLLGLKNFILLGQSFGGAVAATHASLHPSNVHSLVLVDAITAKRESTFFYRLRFHYAPLLTGVVRSRYIPFFCKKLVVSALQGVPLATIQKEVLERYLIMGEIHMRYKVNVDYKDLSMFLLLIWGDKDNYIAPIAQAREIHREVPNSKLAIVKGGHSVLYFHPKRAIEAMVENLF